MQELCGNRRSPLPPATRPVAVAAAKLVGLSAPSVAGTRPPLGGRGRHTRLYCCHRSGRLRAAARSLSAYSANAGPDSPRGGGVEATSCDRVTGEDCFIAKAYIRDVAELEALIDEIIPYAMTNTPIIQSSPFRRRLPEIIDSSARAEMGFINKARTWADVNAISLMRRKRRCPDRGRPAGFGPRRSDAECASTGGNSIIMDRLCCLSTNRRS